MNESFGVVILHYHLNPGGVTRVIQHTVAALGGEIPVVVVTGMNPGSFVDLPVQRLERPALDYSEETETAVADEVLDDLREDLRRLHPGVTTWIWHVHNHALGKNLFVPELVHTLAERGERLLLQIHDFAEDARPKNYQFLLSRFGQGDMESLGACLYPQAPHVHYAVLNRRDYAFLRQAGLEENRLHALPNPVFLESTAGEIRAEWRRGASRFFLYPTRAIRRKNIGELLLWAALGEEGDRFATTLAPLNPVHFPIYNEWIRFAEERGLPVEFEIAENASIPLASLMNAADVMITTSVAEGFGMAFLEPWLADKPLAGRNLPVITGDFAEQGVDLTNLYDRLTFPLEWVGVARLRKIFLEQYQLFSDAYNRSVNLKRVKEAYAAITENGRIDFGRLNEMLQKKVIAHVQQSPA